MLNTKENPIFLLSTRRSGTTLLQRILNSHEKITLWGEHGGFLKPIARSYVSFFDDPAMKNMVNKKRNFEKLIGAMTEEKDQGPIFWHNSLDAEHLKDCYKNFIYSLFTNHLPSNIFWGFKEVRYGIDDPVLRMLSELFPDAKFIYLFRRPEEMVQSAIGAWNKEELKEGNIDKLVKLTNHYKKMWIKQNEFLNTFYQKRFKGNVFYVNYTDLISDQHVASSLFDFLQVDFSNNLLKPLERKFDSGKSAEISKLNNVINEVSFEDENSLFATLKKVSHKAITA